MIILWQTLLDDDSTMLLASPIHTSFTSVTVMMSFGQSGIVQLKLKVVLADNVSRSQVTTYNIN